jgi:hypothetical protein
VTRFLNSESTGPAQGEESTVYALAANASNDAWATTRGLNEEGKLPRLYRFTNGQTPDAPKGNDVEPLRPLRQKIDQPIYELEPPGQPAPEALPLPTITQMPSSTLPPAIYDVKVKLHTIKRHGRKYFSLYLTFKVQRPITLGAQALRRGRVVSVARAKPFTGPTGLLILNVERKRWPTSVQFIT